MVDVEVAHQQDVDLREADAAAGEGVQKRVALPARQLGIAPAVPAARELGVAELGAEARVDEVPASV